MTPDTDTNESDTESRTASQALTALVSSGVPATPALDIYMTAHVGMPVDLWAELRGVTPRAVEQNVEKAAGILDGVGL